MIEQGNTDAKDNFHSRPSFWPDRHPMKAHCANQDNFCREPGFGLRSSTMSIRPGVGDALNPL
jgi:hypothetical protein